VFDGAEWVGRNLNYWDSVSTLAGEVAHPAKVFPKALFSAVFLVVAMYLLPLLACLGVQPNAGEEWRLGYFATVADQVCARPGYPCCPPKSHKKAVEIHMWSLECTPYHII
jgi:amino acid transporter